MKREKIWVGIRHDGEREVFRYYVTPVPQSRGGDYAACIGPFNTVRGAKWMARYGKNNPHCHTVGEAERIARLEAEMIPCPSCGGTGGIGHCNRCNASGYVRKKKGKK